MGGELFEQEGRKDRKDSGSEPFPVFPTFLFKKFGIQDQ